jgi:hypothetical protein
MGRKIISSGTLSVLLGMRSHCSGCQMQLELMLIGLRNSALLNVSFSVLLTY